MYNLQLISTLVAKKLGNSIPGLPVENKILVYSPKEINTTASGIIIPDMVKEGVPRKGVVIKSGVITEEYQTYKDHVEIGRIIEYGLYAGKEHQFDKNCLPQELQPFYEKGLFTVLALNEISYSEPNNLY
jgi:co-chaperonin GroES (HSP10)